MLKKIVKALSAALVVLLAMMLFFFSNGLYPFGENTISWCDMDQQVLPLLLQFKDILAGKEGFFLSFKNAGGMNFFGVFFFFLSSPFSFLVAFIEKADMSSFMNVLVTLKMCACAFTASLYFSCQKQSKTIVNISLAVLYAFSGYVMMYYQNVIWLDMVCLFPLLLLSLERLKQGKKLFFTLALAACMVVNYYVGYMIVVFILLYALVYLLLNGKFNQHFALDFALSCAMAAMLSAIVWLPSLLQYFSSGRTSDVIANLRYSSLPTPVATAYPTIFSILFLLPFALLGGKWDREHALHKILLLLTLVPIFIEPINKMWQTGSYMSFPTRYAFMTIFLCLALAHENLSSYALPMPKLKQKQSVKSSVKKGKNYVYSSAVVQVKTVPKGQVLPWAVGLVMFTLTVIYVVFAVIFTQVNSREMGHYAQTLWGDELSLTLLFTVYAVAMALGFAWFIARGVNAVKPVLLWLGVAAMVLCELYVSPTVYMLTPAHSTDYYKQTSDMGGRLNDETDFFRVKTQADYSYYDLRANTVGGLGYNALGHYTSLTDTNYMTAIKQFGYTSYWMEVGNSGGSILTDALLSIKYEISTIAHENDVYSNDIFHLYPTENYLPLGIVTKADIIAKEATADHHLRGELQQTLYSDFFGTANGGVTLCTLNNAKLYGVTKTVLDNGKILLTPDSETDGGTMEFFVPVSSPSEVYFNVFDENTNALVQGINEKFFVTSAYRTYYNFPSQRGNGFADMGTYHGNALITVRINQPVAVSDVSVFAIPKAQLSQNVAAAKTLGLQAGINKIYGNYTAEKEECVFLSVPFNKGLVLKINGKVAPLYSVYDGFTAFYTVAGENEIEISFTPHGFGLGVGVCEVGILLTFIILFTTESKKRKTPPQFILSASTVGVMVAGILTFIVVYVLPLALNLLK